ncbi:hypothetical protein C1884_21375 [Pseudomonas sp. GW460-R15]|nr:hypothetical protein C1887_07220 [Pseudomonas sp. GW456-R21]POA64389.1 hypothetical protein C1884_21375 [Pseudomonas sp. GW460-R15]
MIAARRVFVTTLMSLRGTLVEGVFLFPRPLAQSIERTDKPAFEIIQTQSGYQRAQRTRLSKNVDSMPQMFDLFDDRHPCITAKKTRCPTTRSLRCGSRSVGDSAPSSMLCGPFNAKRWVPEARNLNPGVSVG